jgi:hypothetical protein
LPRKSRAEIEIAMVARYEPPPRLEPPRGTTRQERKLFREIVANLPHGHLMPTDGAVLLSYVQSCLLARAAFKAIDSDPAAFRTWLDATKAQVNLGRSLRLTVQSREHPRTITRAMLGTSYRPATGVTLEAIANGTSRGWKAKELPWDGADDE